MTRKEMVNQSENYNYQPNLNCRHTFLIHMTQNKMANQSEKYNYNPNLDYRYTMTQNEMYNQSENVITVQIRFDLTRERVHCEILATERESNSAPITFR